ncbi:PQQ-dependent dehydrogenase, methanol/ethanol family [Thalassococcus sp. S3]|uniref:PQQ-dependent dehydrogenase, methanol/ethanol family n=1 Tax=Thalassococcus sp. S3 TaxID=2017482 RepID=UPI001023FA65|nr:PQQ-dependent dehydrogenase, methanol/ethanol family [Thalassococcus sp. S3]QBF33051.1 PQQ-dependent dehydrogenase, methanol/ethanol family [Thalassococcus sp. S3]
MRRMTGTGLALALAAMGGTAMAQELTDGAISASVGTINTDAIIANEAETKNWLSYGLDYAETRFSKLDAINDGNVGELGLEWAYDLQSVRGVEATPIVVDGVMYVTGSWSIVHALNAVTGEELWVYDPEVPKNYAYKGCCDVVNRGVAVYEGNVYVATYDGRLVALEAATGDVVWEVDTIENREMSYTVTGAPRVYDGKVVIGNGGAEYGVRGYLTAYDAETGDQEWRWYSVPGDPSQPYEDESMARAALTWDPSAEYWKAGGGGTMWDSMAYDPELGLLYVGTGNGSPWNRDLRSPAGGDNLYLSSLVALRADTGEYVCHYQEVPGDNWDYTATQTIILADLELEGQERKVMMHAPKSGFFYLVDRTDCGFISAEPFVEVNWALGYDANGRPIEDPRARNPGETFEVIPSPYGAHNWHPMSYSPQTGLVYIPAQGVPLSLEQDARDAWSFNANLPGRPHSNLGWNLGWLVSATPPAGRPFGHLLAWDPVKQEEAWRQQYVSPWNGGTLATAGNLVFQGSADGRFLAYNAETGENLWQTPVGSGIVAAPMTYEVDGVQYVTVLTGWGGVYGITNKHSERVGPGHVYTFRVGGETPKPEVVMVEPKELLQGVAYDPDHYAEGAAIYIANCVFCHGVPAVDSGGNVPNLGFSAPEKIAELEGILLNAAFEEKGMPSFEGRLTSEEITKITAFIQGTADAVRGQ